VNVILVGAPADVTIAADVCETAEVPMVAVTVAELLPPAALLLGWKVVVAVPVPSVDPDEGVKLKATPAAYPLADHTTVSPASTPEAGHPAPTVQVTFAVIV
jgi:hypothetical protein